MRESITHIIHCAWHLNFNLILESYERVHVAGVRHLINLCLSSPKRESPRFVFISSVAATGGYSVDGSPVPEAPVVDPCAPLDQGYAQSKFIGERIVALAVERGGLQATVIRVGQLSGATESGVWNINEHVPILIRSSIEIGMLPEDFPVRLRVPHLYATLELTLIFSPFDGSHPMLPRRQC